MPERRLRIAVVIPCYRVAAAIEAVVRSLPDWIEHVVLVDDASPDATGERLGELERSVPGVVTLRHERNQGVGGAMVTGFRKALELGADVVVKLDGDGQMDARFLPALLQPILEGRAGYAKGNRFRTARDVGRMPAVRIGGNIALTFLTKLASGYWHVFDPQNGYVAISREALERIPLDALDRGYFFENSMLAALNVESTPVADVPMPAIYGDERSNLRIWHVTAAFPFKLLRATARRVVLKYLLYDVSPIVVFLVAGFACFAFSLPFGFYHWWLSAVTGIPATTGTVVLALLPFLLGFQLWLQAINMDVVASPRPSPPKRRVDPADVPSLCEPRRVTELEAAT